MYVSPSCGFTVTSVQVRATSDG
ncbi:hypothetical protein PLANTIT3_10037 [Plantibacter sp. T3]|nr:hypothetical protein PLANTIT3_10037 [Plantibacter sp. T3]